MFKTIPFLALFALANSLWAADPIIGTWKLNVAKSKFPSPQLTFKEQTEVYREIGNGQIERTYRSIDNNGTVNVKVFVFPIQGGSG